MNDVIKSCYESQDEILIAIKQLHCPEGFDCDMTYGNGSFWKNIEKPKLCFDIDPQSEHAVYGDSCCLPVPSDSLGSVVFDPPFLTHIKSGRSHGNGKMVMSSRFGGYWTYEELKEHYVNSIREAYRILRDKGKLIFKCQDIIHNHKMHCTHANVIFWAEIEGFRILDLFVLKAKHRMPTNPKGVQRHSRIFHSYFLVFEKANSGRSVLKC